MQIDEVERINEVVKKLKVKKRRIYDITNVLEGIVKFIIYTRHRLHKKTGEKTPVFILALYIRQPPMRRTFRYRGVRYAP